MQEVEVDKSDLLYLTSRQHSRHSHIAWFTLRGGEAEAPFKPPGFNVEKVYETSPSDHKRGRNWSGGL